MTIAAKKTICGLSNGELRLGITDHPDRDVEIELSLSGENGPYRSIPDNAGRYIIAGLAPGEYDLWTRFAGDHCSVNLGVFRVRATPVTNGICRS